jgi:hypothetical protein
MESSILAALAGAAAMLLVVAVVLTATHRRRSRRDLEAMVVAAQRENDALRQRLEELTARPAPAPARTSAEPADFVITHVGEAASGPADPVAGVAVPDRLVLSATLGEPLVRVAAFSHGVRRALSAESRNRIWFEMRREVRASRRRRRVLRKRLERDHRARARATHDLTLEDTA